LVELLCAAGHKVNYQSSKEKKWKKALKNPGDIVAVAGGDGTVGKVARRLIGRAPRRSQSCRWERPTTSPIR